MIYVKCMEMVRTRSHCICHNYDCEFVSLSVSTALTWLSALAPFPALSDKFLCSVDRTVLSGESGNALLLLGVKTWVLTFVNFPALFIRIFASVQRILTELSSSSDCESDNTEISGASECLGLSLAVDTSFLAPFCISST